MMAIIIAECSKYLRTLIICILIVLMGCREEFPLGYPDELEIVDSRSSNDCSLDICSSDRITRFKAEELVVEYSFKGSFTFTLGIDSYVEMILCEELEGLMLRDKVKVWGELKDACGAAIVDPISEGIYILHIEQLEKL